MRATIATLALPRLAAGEATDAAHALPLYVRHRVALTTAERKPDSGYSGLMASLPKSFAYAPVVWRPLRHGDVTYVAALEAQIHAAPWTAGNFATRWRRVTARRSASAMAASSPTA